MPSEASATVEGPNLSDDSPKSSQAWPEIEPDLAAEHDEILKLSTGLGTLHALGGIDANATQNRLVKEYGDGNMQLWRRNWGLAEPEPGKGDDVGHTVRVDSDNHYHWHLQPAQDAAKPVAPPSVAPPSPSEPAKPTAPTPATPSQPSALSRLLPWILAGSMGAGGIGLGAFLGRNTGDRPPAVDTDTDTRSTLRPYEGNEPAEQP